MTPLSSRGTYLRFEGTLREDLQFEPRPGWETSQLAHEPKYGSDDHRLELLDGGGRVVMMRVPKVDYREPCSTVGGPMKQCVIVTYIPLPAGARRLRFRVAERVLHERPIAARRPTVKITKMSLDPRGRVHLAWSTTSTTPDPLIYNVVFMAGGRRRFLLAQGLVRDAWTAETADLPGGSGRFAVMATDGTRSAIATSRAIKLPDRPAVLSLLEPADGSLLPPDHPVSLCGSVVDAAGAALDPKPIVWELDGQEVATGTGQHALFGVEPGRHEARLRYGDRRHPTTTVSVRFFVGKRNAEQLAWHNQRAARATKVS